MGWYICTVLAKKYLKYNFSQQYGDGWASQVAQRLKCLPAMWETGVRSLGREDPPEKELATHSSTLAWRIPWREEPGRLQSMSWTRLNERLHLALT